MALSKHHPLVIALKIYGPALVLAAAAFLVAYQFVDPAPPHRLVIGAGRLDGAYAHFAARYREILARHGIDLEIRPSRGSVDNFQALSEGKADVAFVQGGTEPAHREGLYSLGSVYFEPLWLFYRADRPLGRLSDLRGLRLAIGPPGSGTRVLAKVLLADNGLDGRSLSLSDLAGRDAAQALISGRVDGVVLVSGAESPLIEALVRAPGIRLLDFRQAQAYTRLHLYLSEVVLPEGLIDLRTDLPDRDVHLIASTASLVVREGVHPALLDLLVQAMAEVHQAGGWLDPPHRFPSSDFQLLPLSPEAKRFYANGPPLLQRYLPFWAATLVDRLKVMLLPLVMVMLPLVRLMPPVYAWRMRARIYRWYKALEGLELRMRDAAEGADLKGFRRELEEIDEDVRQVQVPLAFAAQAYDLRMHIRLVADLLEGKRPKEPASPAGPQAGGGPK
jgi:uncharacterized protein